MEMFSAGGLWGTHRSGGEDPGADKFQEGESSPEVRLLLCRPHHKRDVIVATPPIPQLKGRSFQHVSVHHCHGAKQLPPGGEICGLLCSPGRVLLPGDGLEQRSYNYPSRSIHDTPAGNAVLDLQRLLLGLLSVTRQELQEKGICHTKAQRKEVTPLVPSPEKSH